jgi:hypothetical protein
MFIKLSGVPAHDEESEKGSDRSAAKRKYCALC